MWADSAYTPEAWSVAPFKKPVNGQLTADQRTFNYWVSKVSCPQLSDTRRHMIIIMWARVCIILHNLIIRIEGDNFDETWRDGLVRSGLDGELDDFYRSEEEDEPGSALERARRRHETPGQRFRLKLMNDLFNSPFRNVERRP